jgi:pSer/pThr/pTyr-binding forkhead associated (FHA) protein
MCQSYADGSDGAVFGLMKEIKIGRHKDSDIRVNIPSVSRDHVRIYKDENGQVSYDVIENVVFKCFLIRSPSSSAISRTFPGRMLQP